MSSDNGDPGISTEEFRLLVASDSGRVLGGDAISGRARPVVMPDPERAIAGQSDDDPTVITERIWALTQNAPRDGEAPTRELSVACETLRHPPLVVNVAVAVVILALAMFIVALMMALAVR